MQCPPQRMPAAPVKTVMYDACMQVASEQMLCVLFSCAISTRACDLANNSFWTYSSCTCNSLQPQGKDIVELSNCRLSGSIPSDHMFLPSPKNRLLHSRGLIAFGPGRLNAAIAPCFSFSKHTCLTVFAHVHKSVYRMALDRTLTTVKSPCTTS